MGLLKGIIGLAGKTLGGLTKGTKKAATSTVRTAIRHPHVTGFIAGAVAEHARMNHGIKKTQVKISKPLNTTRKTNYVEDYEVEDVENDKVLLKDYIKNNGKSKIKFKF